MMSVESKIALFIDGANLYATAKALGFDIDYKRLLKEFQSRGTLLRAFYYTAIIEDQEYSSIRPLIDWLDYNGYTVVTKATKEFIDASGRRKVKGNMDIELAVDAMELAEHVDQIVLFSGDGDFRSLVEAVPRRGVRVTVVSTISSQPPMIADELRRQADVFTDLVELQSKLGRDPSERPPPRAPRPRDPQWFNSPVPSFGDPGGRLLIVGLAPGLQGANRTGRPFTGDFAGDLLYATLIEFGFAAGVYQARPDDGLKLIDCRISNAVRCVPPQNKPLPAEINTCRQFLSATITTMPRLRAVVALGRVAHESTLKALGIRSSAAPFAHGAIHQASTVKLYDSYHCSRYNTNTRVLTPEMFRSVFAKVRADLA